MFKPNAPQEDKDKFKAKLDNFIKNMEKILDENGGEWMVGDGFTWADLYVMVVLYHVSILQIRISSTEYLNLILFPVDQEMHQDGLSVRKAGGTRQQGLQYSQDQVLHW